MRALLDGLVEGLPNEPAARIVAQAEGVPLYAIETVRALADRGVVAERDGRLELDGELGELDVPASLGSLLAARLDSLEREERALVKAMSVFGGAFPRSSAVALSEVPEDQLDTLLEALVRKQVLMIRADPLSPDRGQYAFAQGMLRTVAYEMLSRGERKVRHRAAAEHLRRAFPNDGEDVAEVIASHYLDAYRAAMDDPDSDELRLLSLDALRRAAQRAATVGAPDVAERSYRTAVELVDDELERAELTQAAGEMALRAGRLDAALELLERRPPRSRRAAASGMPPGSSEASPPCSSGTGETRRPRSGSPPRFETLGSDRLDAEVGALNRALGHALVFAGRYEEATPALETALKIAQALELPKLLSQALTDKALLYLQTSRVEEARGLLETATEIAERHDLPDELGRAWSNSANLRAQWDLPGGDRLLASSLHRRAASWRSLPREPQRRQPDAAAPVRRTLGGALAARPRAAARRRPQAGYRDRQLPARGHARAARRYRRGPGESRAAGQLGADRRPGVPVRSMPPCGWSCSSPKAVPRRRSNTAGPLSPEAIEALGAANESVRHAWPAALEAALELGRVDAARELVALLSELPPATSRPFSAAQLARGRALTNAAAGDHDAVEAGLTAAIDGFQSLGYPYWLAQAQLDLAAWLQSQGRDGESAPLLAEAIDALELLGAAPALSRARALRASLADALAS